MEALKQECICSLGLDEVCPAHPFREKRKPKPKVSRQALHAGQCGGCVFIREEAHDNGRHPLYVSDVKTALEIGPVFCRIPQLGDQPLIVRGASRKDGVMKVEVLEGEFSSVAEIWMNAQA